MRWSRGQFQRPFAFYEPDEDTIGHSTDSLSTLTGQRSYLHQGVFGSPPLVFAAIDRRCHDAGWYTTPQGQQPGRFHPRDMALELLPSVHADFIAHPTVTDPPLLADDGSEDAYAWVHDRVYDNPPTDPNPPLTLAGEFGSGGRTPGQGLCLGFDGSLVTADVTVGGSVQHSIFVGSADGVVTRFVLNPTNYELDVAAQSLPLSYGAFALAVGELADGHSGPELVVGTKQRLFTLDAATLAPIESVALDFEHTHPRRMQIADVFTGPDYPGPEIVFTTMAGHLVVMSGSGFSAMTDVGEPGIQDFVIPNGPSAFATTMSTVPIVIQSHRGHLAHLTCNKQQDPTSDSPLSAELQAWTLGEQGSPADLLLVDAPSGGGQVVVGLYHVAESGIGEKQIKVFDALTLLPATTQGHGIAPGLGWPELETVGPDVAHRLAFAPIHGAGGSGLAGFVTLIGNRLAWVPLTGQPLQLPGYILDGLVPASRALSVTTSDLCARIGGEMYQEEVILSTLGGHVVWFHLEDLLALGNAQYMTRPPVPGGVNATQWSYTNRTLAGTWGMVAHDEGQGTKLFAANQSGELWQVEPVTGAATLRGELRESFGSQQPSPRNATNVFAPIRDIAFLGAMSTPGQPEAIVVDRINVAGARWVITTPWQNAVNDILRPRWHKSVNPPPELNIPPSHPLIDGFLAMTASGDRLGTGNPVSGASQQVHWWGGDSQTYANLVQELYATTTAVQDSWYSTKNTPPTNPPPPIPQNYYGMGPGDGKDLRNSTRPFDQSYQHQSLRVSSDAFGPLVCASTPGGSIALLRPGTGAGLGNQDFGTILWDSANYGSSPLDDGLGAMGLAVRQITVENELYVDIFVGIAVAHLDPVPAANGHGRLSSAIRWLRWHGTSWSSGSMADRGVLYLDPDAPGLDARGGFGLCGLAIGDVLSTEPGDELVATTMEGDLFVLSIPPGTPLSLQSDLKYRSWVRGALGVNNGIVILDSDGDSRKELFVAGSQGIWKWRQS